MPRRKKSVRQPKEESAHIAVRVDRYDVRSETSVNYYAREPQVALHDTDDDPLYHFLTHLEISGTATYPDERAGDVYEITIYGEDSPQSRINWTLKDVHVRDEHRVPKYRKYRGQEIPVYAPPKGIGRIDKMRGEARWTGALFVPPRYVTDLLILLGHTQKLFMGIDEAKIERVRWIKHFSVQTRDPSQE